LIWPADVAATAWRYARLERAYRVKMWKVISGQ